MVVVAAFFGNCVILVVISTICNSGTQKMMIIALYSNEYCLKTLPLLKSVVFISRENLTVVQFRQSYDQFLQHLSSCGICYEEVNLTS
jgi:hypothetical protein